LVGAVVEYWKALPFSWQRLRAQLEGLAIDCDGAIVYYCRPSRGLISDQQMRKAGSPLSVPKTENWRAAFTVAWVKGDGQSQQQQ
jgi:hypothetical protein